MIDQALIFVLRTLFGLVAGAFLLRFYMQAQRVSFHNPLGTFLLALTNFAVTPLRRVVPGLWGYDLASLFAAWFTELLLTVAVFLVLGHGQLPLGGWAAVLVLSFVHLLALAVDLLMWTVVANALLSWVQPYHWVTQLTDVLTRPFLAPLRRVIPPIGNVDLTPLVLIMLCQVFQMVAIGWLEQLALRLT